MIIEVRDGRRRVRFTWASRTAPTAAERRAIARAVRLGDIRNGDRVQRSTRRRSNPAGAVREYKKFHWGNPHRKVLTVRLPSYDRGLYKLGDLVAVEYETEKGRERAVWVHKFSRPRPVLTATPGGKLGPIVGGRARVTARGIEG